MDAQRKTKFRRMVSISAIARELGVGAYALRRVVDRLHREGHRGLACTKTAKGRFVYDVDAVMGAVAPHLAELRAKCASREAEKARSAQRRSEARIGRHAHRKAGKAKAAWGEQAPKKRTTPLTSQLSPSRRPEPVVAVVAMRKRRMP
jgi:transposase-like protein